MDGRMRLRSAVLPLLGVVLLVGCIFVLVGCYCARPVAFNSDQLWCAALADDLLHGRDVSGWHLPGPPFLLPDTLFLMPCQRLLPTLPLVFFAYTLLLHLALAGSVAWLGKLSGLGWRSSVGIAVCGAVLLVALQLRPQLEERGVLMVHPGGHFGAIPAGAFLLALTARLLHPGRSWVASALYLMVGGLAAYSDRLLIVQFLAPLAAAVLLLAVARAIPWRYAALALGLQGGMVLLSMLIRSVVWQMGFHQLGLPTSFGDLRASEVGVLLRQMYELIAGDRLLCVLVPLHLLAAAGVLYGWVRRPTRRAEDTTFDRPVILLTALTLWLSPLCLLGALWVGHMANNPANERYTLSCWYLPPLLLPLLARWRPGVSTRLFRPLLPAAVVVFAVYRTLLAWPAVQAARFEQPYPPLAQALDRLASRHGPLCGLSNYWTARSTDWFTRRPVVLNPMTAECEPFFHASNPGHFLPGDDLGIPPYRFVVVRPGEVYGPSPSVLTLTFGEPAEKVAVGATQIWLYDSLRTPPLERFLRARLAERLRRRRPYTGPAEPACLASPKANRTPADAPGTVALGAGDACEVRFAGSVSGRLLDVGADAGARLDLELYRGGERLASLSVPPVPWSGVSYEPPGIQSRLVPLPAALADAPWDRLVVRPHAGSARLAHLLVYAESVAGLEDERPWPRLPRVRLEAEEMYPLNIRWVTSAFNEVGDLTASGERVRRTTVESPTLCCFTPRLFLGAGRYRLEAPVRLHAPCPDEEVVSLLVRGAAPEVPERSWRGRDFPAGRFHVCTMTFEVPEDSEGIEFGVLSKGKTPIDVDYMDLIADGDGGAAPAGAR